MHKKIFVFFVLFSSFSFADETYWNADLVRPYVHNSELQRRWAWAFLAPHMKQLRGDESILDMGCGDGKITADISRFVPEGRVLGMDPSLPMLGWAKKQFCEYEYSNIAFREGGFLENSLSEPFYLIISCCAFQHCSDQVVALQNMAKLLNKGGKLLIMVPAIDNEAWKLARKAVQTSSKWSEYWKGVAPRKFFTIEDCAGFLEKASLEPVRIEKVHTKDPFVTREELLDFLLGTFTPAVPAELAKSFYSEMIDEYLKLSPESLKANGVIEVRYGRIEIEAIKP